MSEFSRETLLNIIETDHVQCGESSALARMALASMDSEPVAYIFKHPAGRLFWSLTDESNKGHDDVMPVYASPQPAPERDQVRSEHAEWSQATFGNVGPVGPLKHLSKEALEAAEQPGDLSEWADMQFLLWDAQRRAGITDEQITQAMIEKLAVNKQRSWPEPKDGEPRLHIKEQPALVVLVVPDEIKHRIGGLDWGWEGEFNRGWNACRAAMLKAQPQNAPQNIPEIIPDCWCCTCRPVVLNDMRFVVCPDCGNKRCPRANDHRNACTGSNEPGQEGSAYPAAPQSPGSEPATAPGKWIPVSEQMPEVGDIVLTAMGGVVNVGETECSAANCRFFTSVISGRELPATHWMQLPAAPQEVSDA